MFHCFKRRIPKFELNSSIIPKPEQQQYNKCKIKISHKQDNNTTRHSNNNRLTGSFHSYSKTAQHIDRDWPDENVDDHIYKILLHNGVRLINSNLLLVINCLHHLGGVCFCYVWKMSVFCFDSTDIVPPVFGVVQQMESLKSYSKNRIGFFSKREPTINNRRNNEQRIINERPLLFIFAN